MRIGRFLFLALVAASFVACNDDDDSGKTATEKALITKLYSYSAEEPEQSVSEETLTYDSQGRLTKWNQKNTANSELLIERTATYTYGEGTVSVTLASTLGADTYEVQLDKEGRASRVERNGDVITMTYDEEGHLVRMENAQGTWEKYVWENGNLTEWHSGDKTGEQNAGTYVYDESLKNWGNFDLKNDIRWYRELLLAGLLGEQSKNLIKTEEGSMVTEEGSMVSDYTYELDAKGRAVKMTSSNEEAGTSITEITYAD